jgi:hypothetical protein
LLSTIGNHPQLPYIPSMVDTDFDAQLVASAFALGAEAGWQRVRAAAAARRAGLDLGLARERFGSRGGIIWKFGELADRAALLGAADDGVVRDRLFDILMRRFDFLQAHRAGVVALLKFAPLDPALAVCLAKASLVSMGWLLEGAGVSATGVRGELTKRGLLVVWGLGVRAWLDDESPDLTATMAAVDTALTRADALVVRFMPGGAAPAADAAFTPAVEPEPPADEPDLPFPADPTGLT